MFKPELESYFKTVNNVLYSIRLCGTMIKPSFVWMFTVETEYNRKDYPVKTKLPFHVFDDIRRKLIECDTINTENHQYNAMLLRNGTLDLEICGKDSFWSKDLVDIVKESDYMSRFSHMLRKCNFAYDGISLPRVIGWKDDEKLQDIIAAGGY